MNKTGLIIGGSILLLGGIGAGVYFLVKNKKNGSDFPSTVPSFDEAIEKGNAVAENPFEEDIQKQINKIKANPKWVRATKVRAFERGRSVEEQFRREAVFQLQKDGVIPASIKGKRYESLIK